MTSTVCTKLNVHNNSIHFTWEISNFSLHGKNVGEYLFPPYFKLGSANDKWYLALYPKVLDKQYIDNVGLYIAYHKKNPNIEIECLFAILDSKGMEANKYYNEALKIVDNGGYGPDEFISISDIKNYLINDNLTIVCKVKAGAT